MLCSFVLTTFSKFYGNRHIDHAITDSYIVQRYVDLKPQPSPPQMLGFFYCQRNPCLLCRTAAVKRRSTSVCSIDMPIKDPSIYPQVLGFFYFCSNSFLKSLTFSDLTRSIIIFVTVISSRSTAIF